MMLHHWWRVCIRESQACNYDSTLRIPYVSTMATKNIQKVMSQWTNKRSTHEVKVARAEAHPLVSKGDTLNVVRQLLKLAAVQCSTVMPWHVAIRSLEGLL